MMSGVRSPQTRLGSDGKPDPAQCEPFGLEAHYFTESRLLQRDVEVILESNNNNKLVGSVLHPAGNIAEALLKEGLAKCVDWSIANVTGGAAKYRAAEKLAKEKKVRQWKDYKPPVGAVITGDKEFNGCGEARQGEEGETMEGLQASCRSCHYWRQGVHGKVVEIVNGDALMVKTGKVVRKLFLASIRPPRPEDDSVRREKGFKPLYDIPYMYEAREFLRKKLIGQQVHVVVDYIQQARAPAAGEPGFPEKTCCTVTIGGVNVAE